MVVDPRAVRAFLSRKLSNSDKVKTHSRKYLLECVNALKPKPRFELKPYKHQLAAFLLCVKYQGYLLLLDMGGGKSAIALNVARWRKDAGQVKRVLITVPFTTNIGQWEDQVKLHAPDLTFLGIDKEVKGEDRLEALLGDADVVAITHAGLARILTRGKGKGAIHLPTLKKVGGAFQMAVHDESSLLGGVRSLYFQVARRLRKFCAYNYALTGTPFNDDPTGAWSQFTIVDGGETLGPTLGIFRDAFFETSRNRWGGFEHKFDKSKTDQLYRMMRHRSVRYAEEELSDLPKKVGGIHKPMVVPCYMSDAMLRHVEGLQREFKQARGDRRLMMNAYVRMRSVASGYLPLLSLDGKTKSCVQFAENPKLNALWDLLSADDRHSFIVVHTYRQTGKIITDFLKKKKQKHAWVYGGTKDKKAELKLFTSGKARVLVCSRAAAFGLNLQEASSRMIFFETPDDVTGRKQMEKRIHRSGQKSKCFYWDLVMRGSIDERILVALQEGRAMFDKLLDGENL